MTPSLRRVDLGPAGDYVRLIPVERRWNDLIAPSDTLEQLRALCMAVPQRTVVALVHGPAGAGKTLAAEVVANQLRLDLYGVDVDGLVSRHAEGASALLGPLFQLAERPNAVVVFEQVERLADPQPLLAHAQRRRAPTILETRDLTAVAPEVAEAADPLVALPAPDEADRRGLWQRAVWLNEPAARVDVDALAEEALTGAEIEQRVRAAAALARSENRRLTTRDLFRALP